MLMLWVSLIIVCTVGCLVCAGGLVLSVKKGEDLFTPSPFECGFTSASDSRMVFSLQFFILAIIFLIFDIELIILFPYALKLGGVFGLSAGGLFLGFLMFLTLGLFKEWNECELEWAMFI